MRLFFALWVLFFSFHSLHGVCSFAPCSKAVGLIDVVYTWVDGDDPVWKKKLTETQMSHSGVVAAGACVKSRFRCRDELKYSLRSILKYAPFINHIYIVTCGQTPKWLKDHSKISVVDHKDIFTSKSDLPTFNSQAIEANLHHIENLSECYIYFNDDVFLGAKTKAKDYFSASGKPKIFLASWTAPDGPLDRNDDTFDSSWKNTNALLDRIFGNEKRQALEHAPFAFRRSQMQALEKCISSVFKKVSSHPFRSPDDLVITAGFSQYFLDNYGLVKRSKIESEVIGLKDDVEANRQALNGIAQRHPVTFCIEDAMMEDSPEQDKVLREFFESYFPDKAPWEY